MKYKQQEEMIKSVKESHPDWSDEFIKNVYLKEVSFEGENERSFYENVS